MPKLEADRSFAGHDAFYSRLLASHKGLSEAESHALNARLILILANHIGDPEALAEALDLALSSGAATD